MVSVEISFGLADLILSILLIICGILILAAAYGLLAHTKDDLNNVVFSRLQIIGIVDMVSVFVLVIIGEPALGLVYFVLAPFSVNAIARGHYYGEQGEH